MGDSGSSQGSQGSRGTQACLVWSLLGRQAWKFVHLVITHTALACFDNTPFLGLVQIHASLIVPEDAVHLTCPIASFTSRDEPAAVFEQYHDKVRANTAIASKSVFHNYENMHHGFAGARANLKDTKNVEAFQDVYKRTSAFLDIIFAQFFLFSHHLNTTFS